MERTPGEGESRENERPRPKGRGGDVPEVYEVLDKQALAARLGVSVATVSYYLSQEADSGRRLPIPDGRVSRAPYWYRFTVDDWLRAAQSEKERIRREKPPHPPRGRGGVSGSALADTAPREQ